MYVWFLTKFQRKGRSSGRTVSTDKTFSICAGQGSLSFFPCKKERKIFLRTTLGLAFLCSRSLKWLFVPFVLWPPKWSFVTHTSVLWKGKFLAVHWHCYELHYSRPAKLICTILLPFVPRPHCNVRYGKTPVVFPSRRRKQTRVSLYQ